MVNVEASNKPRIWNTRWTERHRDIERRAHARTHTKAHTHFLLIIALPWASSPSPSIQQIADVVFWKMLSAWLHRERERVAVVVEAWVAGRRACFQSSFVGPPATFPYAHYSSSSAGFAGYVLDLSLLVIGRYSLSLCMRVFPSHYFCPEFLLSLSWASFLPRSSCGGISLSHIFWLREKIPSSVGNKKANLFVLSTETSKQEEEEQKTWRWLSREGWL